MDEALDLAQPEGGDNRAMAHALRKLGSVVDQVASHGDAGRAARIVEVFDAEVAVNGENPAENS